MPTIVHSDTSPDRSTTFRGGNERLYEAYNDLHSLAQDFEKPFDAPAILVVGHQTDGKSGKAQHAQALRKDQCSSCTFWLVQDSRCPCSHSCCLSPRGHLLRTD